MYHHLKGGRGARRHRDEAAEELRVADEERDGECARVGGRDDDHAPPGLRVRRQDGANQRAEEGGPVSHPGAAGLSSPWNKQGGTLGKSGSSTSSYGSLIAFHFTSERRD